VRRFLRLVPVVIGVFAFLTADRLLSDWVVLSEPEILLMDELDSRLPPVPVHGSLVLVTVQESTKNPYRKTSADVGFPRAGYADLVRHIASFGPAVVVLDADFSRAKPEEAAVIDRTVAEHPMVQFVFPATSQRAVDEEGLEVDLAERTEGSIGGLAVSFAELPFRPAPNLHIGNSLDYPGLVSTGIVPLRQDYATHRPIVHIAALAAAALSHADVRTAELSDDRTTFSIGHLQWELGGDQDVRTRYPARFKAFPEYAYDQVMTMRAGATNPLAGKLVVIGDTRPAIDRHETPPYGSQPGVMFVAHTINSLLVPQKFAARLVPEWLQNTLGALFGVMAAYGGFAARKWARIVAPMGLALAGWTLPDLLIRTSALKFDPLILPVTVMLSALTCWTILALRAGFVDVRRPGEVQIATVLFVDVRGSTELTREIGGKAVQRAVSRFVSGCAKAIDAAGGTLERSTGDGFVATFPNKSRSNSAASCLNVVPKVREEASAAARLLGRPFEIKVGLENGPVTGGFVPEQGRSSWNTAGNTINFAARLLDACSRFECDVAIGPVAAAMLSEDVRLRKLGEFEPKGFDATVAVYTLDDEPRPGQNDV